MFELLIFITAFIGLIAATIHDFKTREVPDYISYVFISAAVVLRVFWFGATLDVSVLWWIPVSLGVLVGFGYLMYRAGQWGGGDVKVMIALAILLASFPGETLPFFSAFFLNSLVVGAVYGSVMLFVMAFQNKKTVSRLLTKLDYVIFIIAIVCAISCMVLLEPMMAFFGVLLSLMIGMLRFSKLVEKNIMQQYVPIEKLTEGDWLVNQVRVGRVLVKKREIGLTTEDLNLLKKLAKSCKLSKVKIKVGVPFVPAFLLNLIVTILFGNIMLKLISLAL